MKASVRSARIAPKKLNVIAKMVRGMPVPDAIDALAHTHKKGARILELVLKSAVANAVHNDKQKERDLIVKTIVVNQAQGYRRGVPMARGRTRPMRKFLSHLSLSLGIREEEESASGEAKVMKEASKKGKKAVQQGKNTSKVSGAKKENSGKSSRKAPSSPSVSS